MDELNLDLDNKKIPWTLVDLLAIFCLTFLVVSVFDQLGLIFLPATNLFQGEMLEVVIIFFGTLLQNILLLGFSFWFIGGKYKFSLINKFFKCKKDKLGSIILNGSLGGLGIFFAIMIINSIIVTILFSIANYRPPQQLIIRYVMQTKSMWLFIGYAFLIIVIAPIVEETFFRGLVYSYFRAKYGINWGYFLSAALFGVIHQSVWAFPGIFLSGLGLAYLFEKSKSLITNIIAHMVWNGIVTFVLFFFWKTGTFVM